MRIIPFELFEYTPDLSLCALRKEFGMYDYCLNKEKKNKAMQPFLNMKRNYFNLSFIKWTEEMIKRKHYLNSFYLFYSKNNNYNLIKTNIFLILECCVQWEIKKFQPYQKKISWFCITKNFVRKNIEFVDIDFNLNIYNILLKWYRKNFFQINHNNDYKPKNLNMSEVIENFRFILFKQKIK
jgi:hypothetical protein